MNGLNELITISRYWKEWADPRLIVMVLNNEDLNQVTWEMRAMTGIPKFEATQTLPPFDYAAFAQSVGLQGITIEAPDHIGPAWERALAADRPVVIDAHVDAEVPPIPPHTEWAQAKSMIKALAKGDPESAAIVREGFKEKAQELLP